MEHIPEVLHHQQHWHQLYVRLKLNWGIRRDIEQVGKEDDITTNQQHRKADKQVYVWCINRTLPKQCNMLHLWWFDCRDLRGVGEMELECVYQFICSSVCLFIALP